MDENVKLWATMMGSVLAERGKDIFALCAQGWVLQTIPVMPKESYELCSTPTRLLLAAHPLPPAPPAPFDMAKARAWLNRHYGTLWVQTGPDTTSLCDKSKRWLEGMTPKELEAAQDLIEAHGPARDAAVQLYLAETKEQK